MSKVSVCINRLENISVSSTVTTTLGEGLGGCTKYLRGGPWCLIGQNHALTNRNAPHCLGWNLNWDRSYCEKVCEFVSQRL